MIKVKKTSRELIDNGYYKAYWRYQDTFGECCDYVVEDIWGRKIVMGRIRDKNKSGPIKHYYAWAWNDNFTQQTILFNSEAKRAIAFTLDAAQMAIEEEVWHYLNASKELFI